MMNLSPTRKTYSFSSSDRGIKANTSPSIRRKNGGTIYRIWNEETGDSYIGKTTVPLAERISKHVYNANHPEKHPGKRKLPDAMRHNPENLRYEIVKKNINPEELGFLEKHYINELKPSLNMAAGGGGGISSSSIKSNEIAIEEIFSTPQKKYRLTKENGKVKIPLTPTGKKEKNVIYVIKNEKNGKKLIGLTGQKAGSRASQHQWTINSEKSDSQHRDYVKDIKEHPEDFTFGIIAKSNTSSSLGRLEKECIENVPPENRYNRNKGGGGSTAHQI